MKKTTKAVFIGMMTLLMCACAGKNIDVSKWFSGEGHVNGELKAIEIEWVDGSVELTYGKGEEVVISEQPSENLSEEKKVHWIMDGKTLKIQYSAEKEIVGETLNKRLVVEIPESVSLDALNIDGASSEVKCFVNAEKVTINTASGNVDLDVEKSSKVTVNSASGNLAVSMKEFESADIEAASGNVSVLVPQDANFTASVETVSGKVTNELDMKKDNGKYKNGTGDSKINIGTVSGNIEFKKHVKRVRNLVYK